MNSAFVGYQDDIKNFADLGGCSFLDLQNSSYPKKAEFNNCFIIHSKYFLAIALFVFPVTKYNTTLSPGFLGQRFNNLQRAALLTSFGRHWFNYFRWAPVLTSLIQYGEDSFQIW